ncbi:MAG: hypothetical protein JST08_08100 [Actinobacteria bacterium]|nr:hypothetical protein [Actinomycetota bacterium]
MSPTTSRRIRLILDLDPRSDAPAGTLTAHSGATSPFTGWVGLTRAIELALAAGRGDGSGDEHRAPAAERAL